MKILVTAKDGQVGCALQAAAARFDVEVIALSRKQLDITDKGAIGHAIEYHKPDVLINAAAFTAVDKAEDEKEAAHAINRDGPENLASECAKTSIPFLHISTDFVFDGTKSAPYTETDICNPLSVYGQSKRDGEDKVGAVCPNHIILRTSWVFGGKQNFVETMRRLAKERDSLNVVSDQRGGPTAAADIAECLVKIAKKVVKPEFDDWGIYHYSGGPSVSWYEFACKILEKEDITVHPIPTTDYPTPAKRPANSVLDCQKIKSVFGIEQPNWAERLN
ncbi:MAG: dTDP-4-dehydrorhamnose reductase [Sneathiella sp.]